MTQFAVVFMHCADCPGPNVGYIILTLFLSWVFVLVSHQLAQSTTGLTKSEPMSSSCLIDAAAVLLFFSQIALLVIGSGDAVFSW